MIPIFQRGTNKPDGDVLVYRPIAGNEDGPICMRVRLKTLIVYGDGGEKDYGYRKTYESQRMGKKRV